MADADTRPPPDRRGGDGDGPRGSARRVAVVQAQVRPTLLLAVAFVMAAAVAAVVPHSSGRWLPLHLFLAGGLVLAISGASLLFAVTWSAAPPPAAGLVATQRWLAAGGAAGLATARELESPTAVLGTAGAAVAAALALLMALLATTVRRGVQRRFDAALRWYLAGLACGITGAVVGISVAAGADVPGDLRATHVTLQLLGLVGLVIAGTLPFFVPTEARTKVSPRATPPRLTALLAWQAGAVAVAAVALALDVDGPAAAALGAYVVGLAALVAALPALGAKQVRWAGPRLLQLLAGVAWWAGAVAAGAVAVAADERPFGPTVVIVLVVCGYGQVLWGSLAYLLPVLRAGGHERLSAGFATTRSWPALAAANLAGGALVLGVPRVATVLVALWVVDAAVRVARLRVPVGAAAS